MTFFRQYSVILGIFVAVGITVLLLSSSDLIFSSGITFIDTELNRSSGEEVYVRTKLDFSSQEHMTAFPLSVNDWIGTEYDSTRWKEDLGADIILLRGYVPRSFSQPVFLLIMQAKTESSFHPPPVCYSAQGYEIQDKSKETITITETSWAESEGSKTVPVNKLVVIKESQEGDIIERRVVLYCYVKGNQFTTDTITMIRTEALAPIEDSYETSLINQKEFFNQAIPLMFEPAKQSEWHPIVMEMVDWGIGGYVVLAILICIPLGILIYPRTPWASGE